MVFGKKNRTFKTMTEKSNAEGPASSGAQRVATRLQAAEFGKLSDQERNFVKHNANRDPERVQRVLKNVRKANE